MALERENDGIVLSQKEEQEDTMLKPNLSFEQGIDLVKKLYGLKDVVCLRELMSYDNQNLLIQARQRDQGPESPVKKFVLKLTNSEDSQEFEMHQKMNEILLVLKESGIQCCWPLQNLEGKDLTLEKLSFKHKDTGETVTGHFVARLMSYIPGQYIGGAPSLTTKMCYEAGQLLGKLSCAFENYKEDTTLFQKKGREYTWSLVNVPKIRKHLHVLTDVNKRKVVEEIIDAFEEKVLKIEDKLKKGLIHGDFNDFNILVEEQTKKSLSVNENHGSIDNETNLDVVGVLDFDDLSYTCVVYDVGIALMYLMQCRNLESPPLVSAGIMLAGYLSKHPLTDDEWKALYYCVAARFAQSLVLGLYSYSLQPQNDYLLSTQVRGWEVTFDLWKQEANELYGRWRDLIAQYNQ